MYFLTLLSSADSLRDKAASYQRIERYSTRMIYITQGWQDRDCNGVTQSIGDDSAFLNFIFTRFNKTLLLPARKETRITVQYK